MTVESLPGRSVVSVYTRAEEPYAEIFVESFRTHHPDVAITLLLLDGVAGEAVSDVMRSADIATVTLDDIFEDAHRRMLTELWDKASLRVLARPYLLDHLLGTHDELVFLPIRTWFLGSCLDLFEVLETASYSLAPTLPMTAMLESAAEPGRSLFRLNFTAVRSDEGAARFLRRWKHFISRNQVLDFAHANISALDPAFLPLAETPSFCSRSDEQHRYFTLNGRRELLVNGEPAGSFTFQNDWSPARAVGDVGQVPLRVLHSAYASTLIDRDISTAEHRQYRHDFPADGVVRSPLLREILREHADGHTIVGAAQTMLDYVTTPQDGVMPLARSIWNRRPDLRSAFHSVQDPAFQSWLKTTGDHELGLCGLLDSGAGRERSLNDLMQDLLDRSDLRATYPGAFVAKQDAQSFADWITDHCLDEYPNSGRAIAALLSRLSDVPIDAAALVYHARSDLHAALPWAMTGLQAEEFVDWAQNQGLESLGLDQFQLDAFAFGVGQVWPYDLQVTWRRNRNIQQRFPLGLSIFDQGEYQRFVVDSMSAIDPDQDWSFITGLDLTQGVSPLLQLRQLWASTPTLRNAIPHPFTPGASAQIRDLVEAIQPTLTLCDADDRWTAELTDELCELAQRESPSVRYIGLTRGNTGLGVAARNHANALREADVEVFSQPLSVGQKLTGRGADHENEPFCNATIIHCNDDLIDEAIAQGSEALFPGSIVVAYTVWELEEYEPRLDWGRRVAEIWTPSSFSAASISPRVSIPVQVMPHPIEKPLAADPRRADFGFSDSDVIFGFCADAKSRLERKNVSGLVEAFKIAHRTEPNARLLLKISDPDVDPKAIRDLRERAEGFPVTFLHDDLTAQELASVVETMDCYVSLHRSEGFGLTLAEAMARGKPVIATGYSGNTEFMTVANSYPVRYETKPSDRLDDFFGAVDWAHADIDDAAAHMVHVARNPDDAKTVGERAAREVADQLSPERIGHRMRSRLMLLSRQLRG